jgi:cholesterol transport system auxiliary component
MLTACVLSRPTEGPVHTYVLRIEEGAWAAPPPGDKRATHGILLVSQPQAEPGFDAARMVYLTRPHEVSYYAANQWVDTPARMMAPLLIYGLEQSRLWKTVIPMPSAVRGDYRLDTQDLVLQQEFFQSPSLIRMGLRLQLVGLRDHTVVGTRRFDVVETAPSEDAYGGVVAANRAVTKLLDQVTTWLRGCLSKEEVCNQ